MQETLIHEPKHETLIHGHNKERIRANVHARLVEMVNRQIKYMLWAEAFAATLVFFVLWWKSNPVVLLSWYVFMFLVTIPLRFLFAKKYADAHALSKHSKTWENLLTLLLLLTGAGWSFVGIFLLPFNDIMNVALILFLLVGVAAAANPFYSPIIKMYAIFLIATLFPTAFYLILLGTHFYIFAGLALFTFGILMLITSIISSQLITNSLELGYHNLGLTEDLVRANAILEDLATHDILTGLPNRKCFYEGLEKAIEFSKSTDLPMAVMFMDLDKFKNINDTLGHDVGDKLLVIVAERLRKILRKNDIIGRLGGDEFVLALEDAGQETAACIAARICQSLETPVKINEHTIFITPSIGISFYPQDTLDQETLVRNADIAMYRAKADGGATYKFFEEALK